MKGNEIKSNYLLAFLTLILPEDVKVNCESSKETDFWAAFGKSLHWPPSGLREERGDFLFFFKFPATPCLDEAEEILFLLVF